MQLVNIGFGNVVSANKIVSIVSPDAAPVKRIIQEAKDGKGNYISTKYVTVYENGTSSNSGNAIIYKVGKVGDATKEVNKGGAYSGTSTTRYYNWFSDYPYVANSSYPFFIRGGYYTYGSDAGVFYSSSTNGYSYNSYGFRAALCP